MWNVWVKTAQTKHHQISLTKSLDLCQQFPMWIGWCNKPELQLYLFPGQWSSVCLNVTAPSYSTLSLSIYCTLTCLRARVVGYDSLINLCTTLSFIYALNRWGRWLLWAVVHIRHVLSFSGEKHQTVNHKSHWNTPLFQTQDEVSQIKHAYVVL